MFFYTCQNKHKLTLQLFRNFTTLNIQLKLRYCINMEFPLPLRYYLQCNKHGVFFKIIRFLVILVNLFFVCFFFLVLIF